MSLQFNEPIPDPDGFLVYDRDTSLGINGRGVKRPGRTESSGSGKNAQTVEVGEDVTNQVTAPEK
jgi:hypothetical protein